VPLVLQPPVPSTAIHMLHVLAAAEQEAGKVAEAPNRPFITFDDSFVKYAELLSYRPAGVFPSAFHTDQCRCPDGGSSAAHRLCLTQTANLPSNCSIVGSSPINLGFTLLSILYILCICTNCCLLCWLASVSVDVLMQRQAGLGALLLPLPRRSLPRSSACSTASSEMSPKQLVTRRTPCCINCSKTSRATCAGLCTMRVQGHRGSPQTLPRRQLPREPCRCVCACCVRVGSLLNFQSPFIDPRHMRSRNEWHHLVWGAVQPSSRVAVHGKSSALLRRRHHDQAQQLLPSQPELQRRHQPTQHAPRPLYTSVCA
jgi:hypothetical protein